MENVDIHDQKKEDEGYGWGGQPKVFTNFLTSDLIQKWWLERSLPVKSDKGGGLPPWPWPWRGRVGVSWLGCGSRQWKDLVVP